MVPSYFTVLWIAAWGTGEAGEERLIGGILAWRAPLSSGILASRGSIEARPVSTFPFSTRKSDAIGPEVTPEVGCRH
jgi:hypothetical protein